MAQVQETSLVLEGLPLPPFSARGITQTLEPIEGGAEQRRTANGRLISVSVPELRKYKSSISCEDMSTPALHGVFRGHEVTVHCVAEIKAAIPAGWTSVVLERDAVPDGVRVYDKWGDDIQFSVVGRTVSIPSARAEAVFVAYRPILVMQVVSWSNDFDEWGARIGWSLDLEEV